MKVLHVITSLDNGGAEAVLSRLVIQDKESGNEHHVISITGWGIYAERLEKFEIPVHALEFPRGGLTFFGLVKLFSLIRKIRPDAVQTWMYHSDLIGGVVARLAGIRAVAWGIRSGNLDSAHNSKSTLFVVRLCARVSGWLPRKIVSCSVQAAQLHRSVGYEPSKFVHIPNGYNMDRFKPDASGRKAVRDELGLAEDDFVLGMVARFDVQKNHRNLIDALAHLKQRGVRFTCLMVGVGMEPSNAELSGWIESAGIAGNVRLLSARSDIPAVMNALDVHVLSSLGEAFPNVLAEAMACATPCVTTDVGDAAVIVAEHGWVLPPQNAQALADGLLQAYQRFSGEEAAWQALRAACRAHIMANFELEQMCERYRQVWRECMQA